MSRRTKQQADLNEDPDLDEPERGAGDNSVAAERLRGLIERAEHLIEEKAALASDIKDIMSEAKSAGFDTKVIKALIKIRAQDPTALEEFESTLDTYRRALGI